MEANKTYQWIKAIDRIPDYSKEKFSDDRYTPKYIAIKANGLFFSAFFDPITKKFQVNNETIWGRDKYDEYKIEWLEEIPSSPAVSRGAEEWWNENIYPMKDRNGKPREGWMNKRQFLAYAQQQLSPTLGIDLKKLQERFDSVLNDPDVLKDFEAFLERRTVIVKGEVLKSAEEWKRAYISHVMKDWDAETQEKYKNEAEEDFNRFLSVYEFIFSKTPEFGGIESGQIRPLINSTYNPHKKFYADLYLKHFHIEDDRLEAVVLMEDAIACFNEYISSMEEYASQLQH